MPHKRAKRSVREKNQQQDVKDRAPSGDSNYLENEGIPRSMARVLNAATIRAEYHGKRKRESGLDDGGNSKGSKKKRKLANAEEKGVQNNAKGTMRGILPGESLLHFNRRVEEDMRPLIRDAMKSSAEHERKASKAHSTTNKPAKSKSPAMNKPVKEKSDEVSSDSDSELEVETTEPGMHLHKGRARKSEFEVASTAAPKRLNDIVQAPPSLRPISKSASNYQSSKGGAKPDSKVAGVLSMAQRGMMEAERDKAIARYRALKEAKTGVKRFDSVAAMKGFAAD